MVGTSNPIRLP